MKTFLKLWQRFGEHIDETFIIVVLLLVALVALAVAVMFLDGVASYLQHLLGLNENGKYKVIQTIGFCIGGVLLVWQAWATNQRAKAMENTANSTAAGQQEERLKNAIEHLGHKKNASVRISGAYELIHFAKGTKDKGLKSLPQNVLTILCVHIRQTTGEYKYKRAYGKKPSEEIQSLITLLFAQKHDLNVFENCPINLQGSYLNGADLKHAQLQGAILRDAQLQRAKLQGANLKEAQLQGAHLKHAQMQRADLSKAQLQGARLYKAQLQGATLYRAQLQGVSSQKVDHFSSVGFESRIRDRIDIDSDLDGIIFADDGWQNELPPNSGAETGAYTQEETEQWIAEYQEAIRYWKPQKEMTANADSAPDNDKGD